jgi:hypothetical protein
MNRKVAHLLTRLYPRTWRERYGAEFEALLQNGPSDLSTAANVVWSAVCEHLFPKRGDDMDRRFFSFEFVKQRPSAFLPLGMSIIALAMVLSTVAIYGVVRDPDEGAVAHLWQLLMAGQMPIILFFAIKWLPRAPRQTLYVLAQQAGAALASIALVFFLGL